MADTRTQTLDLAGAADVLSRTLDELGALHETLAGCVDERDLAVSAADMPGLAAAVGAESEIVQQIAAAEQRRGRLAAAIAELLGAARGQEVNASWLAERLPAGQAGRLREAAARLRERIILVQKRNAASRVALESLASHMKGILHATERRLSHSGVYGRSGSVPAGPAVLSTMDLVS